MKAPASSTPGATAYGCGACCCCQLLLLLLGLHLLHHRRAAADDLPHPHLEGQRAVLGEARRRRAGAERQLLAAW